MCVFIHCIYPWDPGFIPFDIIFVVKRRRVCFPMTARNNDRRSKSFVLQVPCLQPRPVCEAEALPRTGKEQCSGRWQRNTKW